MKQLWKKFDKLTEICYMSELEDNCPQWDEAYEVFKQLVAQGREKDPQYAAEILKMDDATDLRMVWQTGSRIIWTSWMQGKNMKN